MMRYSEFIEKTEHGTEDFPIAVYHLDRRHPRYIMDLHWHTEFEIIRVREGHFDLYLNRECRHMTAGDIAFVNPGVLHRGEPFDCEYDCTVFQLEMLSMGTGSAAGRAFKPLLSQTQAVRDCLPAGADECVSGAVNALFDALFSKGISSQLAVCSSLYALFAALYQNGHISAPPWDSVRQKQLSHLTALLEWIDEHYTQKITLSMLAKRAGLNEKYLCRFFKEYTSYTPIDYINRLRVERAAADIKERGMTLTEAAYANGFNDSAYFSKIFRRVMGVSPREYRTIQG